MAIAESAQGRLARLRVVWSLLLTLAAAVMAMVTVWVDEQLVLGWDRSMSLASVRTLLATVAGTMVTATVVVFWIRGLLVGNRANRFPVRVVEGYLQDRQQLRLMSLMIGVFVYAAVVLLSLPPGGRRDDKFEPVPTVSVLAVTALTGVALLAIVHSVDAGLRAMHEHRILRSILDQGLMVMEADHSGRNGAPLLEPPQVSGGMLVRSSRTGWVHRIDDSTLAGALPKGSVCHLHIHIGQFVTPATRLFHITTPDSGHHSAYEFDDRRIEAAIVLGETRSTTHDMSFAVRNLVDIAMAGLSSVGSDHTIAREAILHLGALLRPLLIRAALPSCTTTRTATVGSFMTLHSISPL